MIKNSLHIEILFIIKNYVRIILFGVVTIFCLSNLYGQDAHLSQFYATDIVINPGQTGMFDGEYRGHMHYRNQWSSVLNNPFVTGMVSFDRPYKRFGFGGYIFDSKAGVGGLNSLTVVVGGAYNIINDPSDEHHFTAGVQIGFIQKSISTGDLLYNSQYSGINGTSYDPNLPSNENFAYESFIIPEANFGIHYYNTSITKKVKPYGSISAFHLTRPSESFYGNSNKLPIRFLSELGAKIDLSKEYFLEPNILIMKQVNVYEFNVGVLGYKNLKPNIFLFAGPYYRNNDAFILHTGILYEDYRFGISYDINSSSLKELSGYQGGLELSFTYIKSIDVLLPSIY